MKKSLIILLNVIIIAAILIFVVFYSRYENQDLYRRQIENFENTTVTMERVTENYLEGEQGICDIWAQYICSQHMTLEEATSYVRSSHVLKNTSAHFILLDSLTGLSTRPKPGTDDDYDVSYERLNILGDGTWIDDIGESINITRAYTNPKNGEQSIAFCNIISVYDPESGSDKDAVVLRIIPISALEQKWIFPQSELENAELSMIDVNGDYILKGSSF